MTNDLISRSALGIGRCNPDAFPEQNRGYVAGWNGVVALIEAAPTIDPESLRPKGRWVYDAGNMEMACSECLCAAHVRCGDKYDYILSDYCPNCGAKMEG